MRLKSSRRHHHRSIPFQFSHIWHVSNKYLRFPDRISPEAQSAPPLGPLPKGSILSSHNGVSTRCLFLLRIYLTICSVVLCFYCSYWSQSTLTVSCTVLMHHHHRRRTVSNNQNVHNQHQKQLQQQQQGPHSNNPFLDSFVWTTPAPSSPSSLLSHSLSPPSLLSHSLSPPSPFPPPVPQLHPQPSSTLSTSASSFARPQSLLSSYHPHRRRHSLPDTNHSSFSSPFSTPFLVLPGDYFLSKTSPKPHQLSPNKSHDGHDRNISRSSLPLNNEHSPNPWFKTLLLANTGHKTTAPPPLSTLPTFSIEYLDPNRSNSSSRPVAPIELVPNTNHTAAFNSSAPKTIENSLIDLDFQGLNSSANYDILFNEADWLGLNRTNQTDLDNHLFRAGRQTHDAFIRRILNAVSGDTRNHNRYVHVMKPTGTLAEQLLLRAKQQQMMDLDESSDLGLPPSIANEYIDGVNPPKFHGVSIHPTAVEKNEWRQKTSNWHGKMNQTTTTTTSTTKPLTVSIVTNALLQQPKPQFNQIMQNSQQTFGKNRTINMSGNFVPSSRFHYPMSLNSSNNFNSNDHKIGTNNNTSNKVAHRSTLRPGIVSGNFNPTNRNLQNTVQKVQNSRSSANQNQNDLTLLLKQEFDAKNAELNQTHVTSFSMLHNDVVNSPTSPGVNSYNSEVSKMFQPSIQMDSVNISSNVNQRRISMNPPYQFPLTPLNLYNSGSTDTRNGSNTNSHMKPGVHYRPILVNETLLESSTATSPSINKNSVIVTLSARPKSHKTPTDKNRTSFHRVKLTGKHGNHSSINGKNRFKNTKPSTTTTTTTTTTSLPTLKTNKVIVFQSKPSSTSTTTTTTTTTTKRPLMAHKPRPRNDIDISQIRQIPQIPQIPQIAPVLTTTERVPIDQIVLTKFNDGDELSIDESQLSNTTMTFSNSNQYENSTENTNESETEKPNPTIVLSSNYRLTTERLAYILIGSCCALSVLCLVIVAMSVRCKDMCDEYKTWKEAEKAAMRWHRHNRFRIASSRPSSFLPYHLTGNILSRNRLNLPRYFRTSIGDAAGKLPPDISHLIQPGYPNKSDKMLDTILNGTKMSTGSNGSTCCHCINCSSTWFFRNLKHGDWCCQQGYLQPPRRTKLPFGAASSVNTFMPRFSVNQNGMMKPTLNMVNEHQHHNQDDHQLNHNMGYGSGGEDNIDMQMCYNRAVASDFAKANNAFWNRVAKNGEAKLKQEKQNLNKSSGGANSRYFPNDSNFAKCNVNSVHDRTNPSGTIFCEIDDEIGDEDDEDEDMMIDEATTDFSNVFDPNFDGRNRFRNGNPSGVNGGGAGAIACNLIHPSSSIANYYHQKCGNFPMTSSNNAAAKAMGQADHIGRSHHSSKQQVTTTSAAASVGAAAASKQKQGIPVLSEYFPNKCKYYFDSQTIHRDQSSSKPSQPAPAQQTQPIQPKHAPRQPPPAQDAKFTNGENSTIWIDSSKIVDKLHQKHLMKQQRADQTVEPNNDLNRFHGPARPLPNVRPNRMPVLGPGGDSNFCLQQSVAEAAAARAKAARLRSTNLDPSNQLSPVVMLSHLGLLGQPQRRRQHNRRPQSQSDTSEDNFVVWNNDTNDRLI